MDPKTVLKIINDREETHSRRVEAVHDLAEWMGNGGVVPFSAGIISDETQEDSDVNEYILAINCALVNSDDSGLLYLLGK